ncbi:UNVERIFIED_CONTAM: type II toxin-antitoxin system RelE/ParE family toxin [Methylobacteriaceae bacterium AG10]|nr:type II toxin-antitoxin system RelE/ParE family toxin [Methylobacteriaceae bacterium AG10]
MRRTHSRKECIFLGSSLKDLTAFPREVRADFGYALDIVQRGDEPLSAKALKGFGGRGTLELVEDHDGNTYRAVYTVKFADIVYVLHCFQKKSSKGIATPQREMDLVRKRLQLAEADYARRTGKGGQ